MNTLRRRQALRAERGASMVEGAIIAPVFFALILAVLELGPLYFQWSGIKDSTREGARTASTAGRSALADHTMVGAVRRSLGGRASALQYVIVFKADGVRDTLPPECLAAAEGGTRGWNSGGADPAERCTVYRPADFLRPPGDFGYDASTNPTAIDVNWPGQIRKDWVNGPPDHVGVFVRGQYRGVVGIFPSPRLDNQIIVQIEPKRLSS